MQLQPTSQDQTPDYPLRRHSGLLRVLRRSVAAALSAGALLLAGCDLPLDPFEPRLSGDIAAPSAFWCGEAAPESPPELSIAGYNEGELCGAETAWATVALEEQRELRFSFPYGVTNVAIDIISPDDEVLGQLTPESAELVLTLAPGRWLLAATTNDPADANQFEWFTLSIDEVSPEG